MSPDTSSTLHEPRGPVHTGTGDINVVLGEQFEQLVRLRGKAPHSVAQDHLDSLSQRFVSPENYTQAQWCLEKTGTVLLTGPSGVGRRTAAMMLFDGDRFQELAEPDEPGESLLDPRKIETGARLLLDLSNTEETHYRRIQRDLSSFRAEVTDREARLVVVLPQTQDDQLSTDLRRLAVELGRPDGRTVFQRHLRADGIGFDTADLAAPELARLLENSPVRELADLANLVRRARERTPRGDFPTWRNEAIARVTDRAETVAAKVTNLRAGPQRALLLSAAMFEGATPDAVFHATDRLLNELEHPEDEKPLLERPDLAERLAEIGVKPPGKYVHFGMLSYGEAVRRHFWSHFPDMREQFRDWVDSAIELEALSLADRTRVVSRFAKQCLRTQRPDDLIWLAEQWTRRTENGNFLLLPHAAEALELGLGHGPYGWRFRHRVYRWSREPRLSKSLRRVLIKVCVDTIAPSYPEQALVRLHHLARRENTAQAPESRKALRDLVDNDDLLFRRLLDRLAEAVGRDTPWPVDLDLFLELADPTRLTDATTRTQPLLVDAGVHAQLIAGWRAVMSHCAHDSWGKQLAIWLQASENERHRESLLNVLVMAADGRNDVLSRLYVIAKNWTRADPEQQAARTPVATRLQRKIDAAQGIEPADFPLANSPLRTLDRGDSA
jgi:hypothetical protein